MSTVINPGLWKRSFQLNIGVSNVCHIYLTYILFPLGGESLVCIEFSYYYSDWFSFLVVIRVFYHHGGGKLGTKTVDRKRLRELE